MRGPALVYAGFFMPKTTPNMCSKILKKVKKRSFFQKTLDITYLNRLYCTI